MLNLLIDLLTDLNNYIANGINCIGTLNDTELNGTDPLSVWSCKNRVF